MKILHVVPTYFPAVRYGGPIFSVHGLCSGQVVNGHDVSVYTTDVDGPNSLDVDTKSAVDLDGVKIRYFKANQIKQGWSRRLYRSTAMAKLLRASINDFDIVHLHSIYLWPTWFAARQAKLQNVPYVLSPRGMLVKELIQQKSAWLKRAWLLLIERSNINHASALHYTSEREQIDATDYVKKSHRNNFVLPNGIDAKKNCNIQLNRAKRKTNEVLYLGRVNWKKGLERLISAIGSLPDDVHLCIAGNDEDGYAKKLDQIITEQKLQHRVKLIGFVDGEIKQNLLSTATLLVLCSDNENFGNVVLEAMAAATPVVVTSSIGAAEVVQKYQTGIVSRSSSANIAENIQKLIDDPTLRQQLGENGFQVAHEHYIWPKIASKMVNHYESILSGIR